VPEPSNNNAEEPQENAGAVEEPDLTLGLWSVRGGHFASLSC
jgi:hypothetical protein